MLNSRIALLALGLVLALETPAPGQGGEPPAVELSESDLVLRYYTVTEANDIEEFVDVARRLFGPHAYYLDRAGDAVYAERFLSLDMTLIVRDSATEADRIVAGLAEIERELSRAGGGGPLQQAPELESFEYVPRYAKPYGLEHFYRELTLAPVDAFDRGRLIENIDVQGDGRILIRETPAQLAKIRAYLERIDVPAPQATFSILVIRGLEADEAEPGARSGVPSELAEHLRQLIPVQGFELLSTGVLRSSLREPLRISTRPSDELRFDIRVAPLAFDPATGELTIEKCSFLAQTRAMTTILGPDAKPREQFAGWEEQSFETALSLRAGEYTVLGSVGQAPLFVVLRMTL